MGRPIGSLNRQRPFTDALRLALLSGGGRRLRIIAEKLADKAEQGDIQAIRRLQIDWTASQHKLSNAVMSHWKRSPTANCSRSFGADHASR